MRLSCSNKYMCLEKIENDNIYIYIYIYKQINIYIYIYIYIWGASKIPCLCYFVLQMRYDPQKTSFFAGLTLLFC